MMPFLKVNFFHQIIQNFISGDSCMNQLLPFDHEFLNSFVKGLEVRGMFLDILKAFEKV